MAKKSKPDLDAVDRQMARPSLTDDERQLRDMFATAALVGLMTQSFKPGLPLYDLNDREQATTVAHLAYQAADAMLAERKP